MKYMLLEIQPRFYEIDSYNVVNNMYYFSWFELGRFAVAKQAGIITDKTNENEDVQFMVLSGSIKYIQPVKFSDKIVCKTCIKKITGTKITFYHRIENTVNKKLHSEGNTETGLVIKSKLMIKFPSDIKECIDGYIKNYQKGFPR